jgi:hypothetical protein
MVRSKHPFLTSLPASATQTTGATNNKVKEMNEEEKKKIEKEGK